MIRDKIISGEGVEEEKVFFFCAHFCCCFVCLFSFLLNVDSPSHVI